VRRGLPRGFPDQSEDAGGRPASSFAGALLSASRPVRYLRISQMISKMIKIRIIVPPPMYTGDPSSRGKV
jgi:hypothetical protein